MYIWQRPQGTELQRLGSVMYPGATFRLGELDVEALELEHDVAQFDTILTISESDQGLLARLDYNTDLFDRATAERLAEKAAAP